jgi:hypothetical protein
MLHLNHFRFYETPLLGEEQYELHTRWLWKRLWKGIISSSKSTTILTAIMSNSASHFGGRNGFTGGANSFPGGGNCPLKKALLVTVFLRGLTSCLEVDGGMGVGIQLYGILL